MSNVVVFWIGLEERRVREILPDAEPSGLLGRALGAGDL